MKSKQIAAFTAALLIGVPSVVQASIFVSFEEAEGFTPGEHENSAGWTFSPSPNIRVSNGSSEPALDGSLSIYARGGTGTSGAQNTSIASAEAGYDTFSVSFSSPVASFTANRNLAWIYIYLWDQETETRQAVQLVVRYGGDAAGNYSFGYSRDDGSGGRVQQYVSLDRDLLDLGGWNDLKAVFDFEQQSYTVTMNDVVLGANIALPTNWDVSAVTGTWLLTPGVDVTTYYDAVQVIPEPSTYCLLGLTAAGVVMLRRRQSAGRS